MEMHGPLSMMGWSQTRHEGMGQGMGVPGARRQGGSGLLVLLVLITCSLVTRCPCVRDIDCPYVPEEMYPLGQESQMTFT